MNQRVTHPFVDGSAGSVQSVLAQLDAAPLYVIGGRQRSDRALLDNGAWYGYGLGVILKIDGSGVTTALEYTSRPGSCASGDPVLFKSASRLGDRLYCCTQTEVLVLGLPNFTEIAYISLPMFNDVHHVVPTQSGTLLVAVSGLEMVVVAEESWVACLPRTHRLAGRSRLRINELLDEPIVVAPASAGRWRDYWMATDARHGRPANIVAEAATYEAETTLIARGVGISFTTSSLARLYDRPGVCFVPIVDRPVSYTALAWRTGRLSTSARQLVQHMLERIPSTKKPLS